MSNVPFKDSTDTTRRFDTFQRTEGSDVLETQAVAVVDPANGNPLKPDGNGALPLSPGAATETTLAAILAKLISSPATAAGQDAGNVLLNAIGSAMATAAAQATGNASLSSIDGKVATQTTLAAILAKLIAAPATEAKQDAIIAKLIAAPSTEATVAAILAKLITAPATEAKQDAIIAKLISAPATEATVAAMLARLAPLATRVPMDHDPAMPVRQLPVRMTRCSFSQVGAGLLSPDMVPVATGAGQAVSQSNGNLVITSGTTANAETLARSVETFNGALQLRYKTILSQRIAQNNFSVELADLVGDSLAYTINSATSVTVTFPTTNPFTAANVGQSVNLSAITGAAGIPGRFAIASVSGLGVTFTVAGWPASGSGTLTLWGWNYYRALYDGTTATNVKFDAQRNGWASGDTTLTINTTASPGHVGHLQSNASLAGYSDALVASNAAYQFTPRGSRIENIPDDDVPLYLWLRCLNGTSVPASTTTWTVGFWGVEETGRNKVYLSGADQNGAPFAQQVQVANTVTVDTELPAAAALADAAGNPTTPIAGAAAMLFNGASWDRARGMSGNLTTGDTGAKSATGNGATIANVGNKGVQLLVNLGAFSGGTAPTITFKVQGSPDGGTSWYDIPGATTAALTAAGLYGITIYPGIPNVAGTTTSGSTATTGHVLPRTWRVVWTITGAPTGITITSILYNYLPN